ncbi:MAG: CopG family ribbon-helix-helix protein [Thermosynechococcaceae cyanobacterium]
MPETATITVRLDAQLKQKLEALSKSTQRSKSWLAAEAISAYVEQEAWQLQQIEAAIQQAEQPDAEWVTHEKVSAWLNTWGDEDEVATAPCP